jgi:chitin disaccharide deacetylase
LKRLIINADDLGLTPGVNRAIAGCYLHGVVTSSTLMAASSAFDQAAHFAIDGFASSRPGASPNLGVSPRPLSIGCHVMLVDGEPLSPPDQVSSLLAPGTQRFRQSITEIARAALTGKLHPVHIYDEASAQFDKLQSAGITISHFDTHKHTHMFPQILRPLLRAARDAGIRAVRNPFAPIKPLAFAHLLRRPRLWTRYSEVAILRRFSAQFHQAVTDAGMVTTDGSFGVVVTGALDQQLFNAIVGCIPDGTWEFVCHPGYNDADLDRIQTRLRASRSKELDVLTSPSAREALTRHNIELISYNDL